MTIEEFNNFIDEYKIILYDFLLKYELMKYIDTLRLTKENKDNAIPKIIEISVRKYKEDKKNHLKKVPKDKLKKIDGVLSLEEKSLLIELNRDTNKEFKIKIPDTYIHIIETTIQSKE